MPMNRHIYGKTREDQNPGAGVGALRYVTVHIRDHFFYKHSQ